MEEEHHRIFSRSLQAIKTLERDIYKLNDPGFCILEYMPPSPDPLAGIWYSCIYWVDHLESCEDIADVLEEFEDGESLDSFLKDDFLHWVEATSLLGSTWQGIGAMLKLESLVRVSCQFE